MASAPRRGLCGPGALSPSLAHEPGEGPYGDREPGHQGLEPTKFKLVGNRRDAVRQISWNEVRKTGGWGRLGILARLV